MALKVKSRRNISKQKVDERKQPAPPGVPIACIIAFCIVFIPVRDLTIPFAMAALDLKFLVDFRSALAFTAVPAIILVIAELMFNKTWRSILFSVGSVLLIIEWLSVIGQLKPVPWVTFVTSLPFIVFILFWNARSLNFILGLDKRWTALP